MSDPIVVVETPAKTPVLEKLKKPFTKKRVQHAATAVIAAGATLIVVSKLKDRNEQTEDEVAGEDTTA